MSKKLDHYKKRLLSLNTIFDDWRTFYRDVTRYLLPRRGMYLEDGKPSQQTLETRQQYTLNSTGTRSIRTLGAGMQGGLSSPSRPWYKYGLMDTDLAEFGPVKDWLAKAEKVGYQLFRRSNFYTVAHTCYEEQGGFGTSVVFFEEDVKDIIRFKMFTAGEYRLALGADGRVNTIYFPFFMSAQQLVEMFGKDKVSNTVLTAMNTNPYMDIEVVHAIEPRKDRDRTKIDNLNMPFSSVWYEATATETFLRESGYKTFPAATPRWSALSNVPYGLGPGHDALGSTKMLQEMEKTGLKGLHKMVDPPMRTAPNFKGILDLTPGANNAFDKDTVGPLYDINLPLQELAAKMNGVEAQIEKIFYNDMFLMLSALDTNRDVSATEVAERHEEKLLMLGPTIERQEDEFLSPSVNKVFEVSVERGLLPPPPEEIQGK
ncbi:MAG: head-tail connector protein, partial [Gammaproteobacteria bacterium]|nr:head-tail connector protein [Gammaproteobacteria bacterium]